MSNCKLYSDLVSNLFVTSKPRYLEDIPYVPATLFKELDLISIPKEKIFKTMTSSGTSNAAKSKIFLDRDNASLQTKALVEIVSKEWGTKRSPLLILDNKEQITNRSSFSARGAGILGFSIFGSRRFFALDKFMSVDEEQISFFINCIKNTKIMYGFTSIIWEEILEKLPSNANILGLQKAIMIHGGGWKKLSDKKISNKDFVSLVKEKFGKNVIVREYYGMVEQTGSIFMRCSKGFFHINKFNDIIIRNSITLKPSSKKEEGVIQVFSTLPTSYPGFSILTEDLGMILGYGSEEDICKCGTPGKYFLVNGRLLNTEIRGCSNTYNR